MIRAFFRMLKACFSGRYRVVPWRSMGLFGPLLLYLFSPLDILPDYIPFVGYIDDLVLLVFFLRSIKKDVGAFRSWESKNAEVGGQKSEF